MQIHFNKLHLTFECSKLLNNSWQLAKSICIRLYKFEHVFFDFWMLLQEPLIVHLSKFRPYILLDLISQLLQLFLGDFATTSTISFVRFITVIVRR